MYEHRDDIQPPAATDHADVVHRRLRWALWGAVVVTLVAAVPGILLDRGGDDSNNKVTATQEFAPATTTTTAVAPAAGEAGVLVSVPPTTVAKGVVKAVSTGAATTTTAHSGPPTTTPAKPCRNSYDAACGPFRWDPATDPNETLTVSVTPPSQQVKAAEEVNFHIVADDPDAKIDRCYTFDFGDDQKGSTCPAPSACATPYGPWTPPAKVHDHYELDVKHRYATSRANPYVASFQLQSHSFCNPDPYGGSGQAPASVTVT